MAVPFRRVLEALRFFLLLVTCTLLSYGLVSFLSDKLLHGNPYREPHGNAVKVIKLVNAPASQSLDGYVSRLQLFYLTGE